jgi:hypothetical protein
MTRLIPYLLVAAHAEPRVRQRRERDGGRTRQISRPNGGNAYLPATTAVPADVEALSASDAFAAAVRPGGDAADDSGQDQELHGFHSFLRFLDAGV